MTDISKHVYVPKHIKLAPEESEQLMKKYNISKKQLPIISIKDPAIQTLEPAKGDVIKIIRNSTTNGEAVFYRLVA